MLPLLLGLGGSALGAAGMLGGMGDTCGWSIRLWSWFTGTGR